MLGLVHVPAVHILVHHQHTQLIAGVEQVLGGRVVGRTHGVVTSLLQNAHTPLLHLGIAARAEKPVVVVDARAADHHALTVDGHALLRRPAQDTQTEALLHAVRAEAGAGGVELRRPGVPEFGVRDHGFQNGGVVRAGLPGEGENRLVPVQYLQPDLTGGGGFDRETRLRRGDGERLDTQTV